MFPYLIEPLHISTKACGYAIEVLKGMKVGKHVIDLEFAQGDDEAEWRALKNEQGLKIIKRPFMPLLG